MRIMPIVGSKHVPKNKVLATETEFYNIKNTFNLNVDDDDDIQISFHPVPSLEHAPKMAETVLVSLLAIEYDLPNDFLKKVLSNHFATPKLISPRDIFIVELTPEITAKFHYKYLDFINSLGRLHFKCRKVSSDSINKNSNENLHSTTISNYDNGIDLPFYIVKGETQLSLGENIHVIKPRDEYFTHGPRMNRNLPLLKSCPNGLRKKFSQMQEALYPFISGVIGDLSSSLTSPIIPIFLLTGSTGSGRNLLVKTLAKYNGLNCLQIDCNALQSSTAKQTESKINNTIQKAKGCSPVIVLLDNFEVFGVDSENNEDCRVMEYFMNSLTNLYQNYTKHSIIFIAVADRSDLKPNIRRIFLERFHILKPNAQERFEILKWFSLVMGLQINKGDNATSQFDNKIFNTCETELDKNTEEILQRVAAKTETFRYGDIDTLMHFALRESYIKQHNSANELASDPNLSFIQEEDFNSALESIRNLQSQHLDAPKIPKVYWNDIGGLDKLKKELLKTIEFPIKYPHLFKNSSFKRSGILLYGPPGCGKTLIAKAISTELNVSFLSVKGPELLNMYIGQSEENVRKVFESARASSPCIVFLDELDALAPRRGAAGDSGGASDRVVSQLLAEVDGVTYTDDADTSNFVFIMGATNRPDLLEQSLLRPGRLDKLIYVGPYSGLEEKTKVLTALCRSHKLRPEVKLDDVAAALPERCTGADLMQVVSTARAAAVRALVNRLHSGIVKENELNTDSIILGVSELWEGVQSFRPSVTEEELAYYESLQRQM
ncbi:Peroxisome assembly factor 2 [Eumeta japonica]|uniref:Peroxisomal ATPase PEX6 n=1 Tax=Eumeta variegata TaxID=151549 RepID=A0A4C1ZEJ5_EUMVA|nr:Peroxisome assembly factor 2 [Eumeta japonica]